MNAKLAELQWQKFTVLNDGFVTLVDVMGDDAAVVQAARVSFGADERQCETCKGNGVVGSMHNPPHEQCGDCKGSGKMSAQAANMSDRTLIRYLMRHNHATPFEMAEVNILVRVPMDCWRQWIRHRTANVNEYSTRYQPAIDERQTTKPDEWRLQSDSNKQGSSDKFLPVDGPEDAGMSTGLALSQDEQDLHEQAIRTYRWRLKAGVAREQARKDLPLSTYTEAYWKCDLRNVLGFLLLRMDSHAQWEIRQYATIIGERIIKPLFPIVWEAFEDYRLHAMMLSRMEVEWIRKLMDVIGAVRVTAQFIDSTGLSKRELEELATKLRRFGVTLG